MISTIATLTLSELQRIHDNRVEVLESIKEDLKDIAAELTRRFAERFADKESGTVSFSEDRCPLKFERKKVVSWDSGKLLAIANTLPPAEARRLIKVEASVPEPLFKALEPAMADRLLEARSVKFSDPKVSFAD